MLPARIERALCHSHRSISTYSGRWLAAVDAAVIQNQHQRPDVKDIIVLRIAPTQQRVDATDMYSVVVYIVSNCYAYALTYYLYYYILYNN